ncbi:MAG: NAD(P)/FAD-dependent oxidoreductase [Cyanobacterium sp.]
MNSKYRHRICIIGGGFGGLYTAIELDKLDRKREFEIILIDQNQHFLFTPLLYEAITEEITHWEIAPKFNFLLRKTNITFINKKVINISFKQRQILFQDKDTMNYDYTVLAVGQQSYFAVEGAEKYAHTFKTLKDVLTLEDKIEFLANSPQEKFNVTVVGAGANGVEIAGKITDKLKNKANVILIDRGKEILKNFPKGMQKYAWKSLKKRNVQIYLETNINKIEEHKIYFKNKLNQNYEIDFNLTVWTGGNMTPKWVKKLNLSQDEQGKILTKATFQLFDFDDVFAIGDLVTLIDRSGKKIPAKAQAAFQGSHTLAKNIMALSEQKKLKSFRYQHLGDMMTVGINDDIISVVGITITGFIASVIRKWAYIFRMPTFNHCLEVVKHRIFKG